jgi:hypothetical protein
MGFGIEKIDKTVAGYGPFDLGFRIWDLRLKRLIGWVAKDEMWRIDFWIVVLYFK